MKKVRLRQPSPDHEIKFALDTESGDVWQQAEPSGRSFIAPQEGLYLFIWRDEDGDGDSWYETLSLEKGNVVKCKDGNRLVRGEYLGSE